jgi:hypothetical protein
MSNLEYSIEARNVLNKFYGVERIVYVEGEDDIAFWEFMFEKLANMSIKAEEVGGKDKLASRITEIRNGNAKFFVAKDSDFDWTRKNEPHPQIISTFGYSMENSIISAETLQSIVGRVAKVSRHQVKIQKCQEWLASLEDEVQRLVLADAFNRYQNKDILVVPDNCDRFLTSSKSSKLSSQKISAHLEKSNISVDEEFRIGFVEGMDSLGLEWIDVLRGHFLISAAFRFVKEYVEELKTVVSISREMLFGALMLAFEANFGENHRHFSYYRSVLSGLK